MRLYLLGAHAMAMAMATHGTLPHLGQPAASGTHAPSQMPGNTGCPVHQPGCADAFALNALGTPDAASP